MKKSIIVAIVSLCVIIGFSIYGTVLSREFSPGSLIRLGIQALLLYGLFLGHRLVWQWGRFLTILVFIGLSAATLAMVSKSGNPMMALPAVFFGVPSLIIFIAFGTTSAREHFKLICPNCSSKKVKADDFLFKKAKCKECNLSF